jgi:NAD(P)-dependent dehydrogenase (short-subunit alcohol dehydrogenase family)
MKLGSNISAIVTGGASGLGAASARALTAAGVKVAVFDTNREKGEPFAASIGALFCYCDVTSEATVSTALELARETNGPERLLVNCAGIVIGQKTVNRDKDTGAVAPHNIKAFEKVVMVNLVGTFHMISRVAASMVTLDPLNGDGERGVIVNTASVAAEDGQIGQAAYAASKGGVAALTLPVARDLARDGVRVATILPGLFETPMFAMLSEDKRAALAASVPFPSRLGKGEEYAALVKHICENEMLNGALIRLDGAVRLAPR